MTRFATLALSALLIACAGNPANPSNGNGDGNGALPPPVGDPPRSGAVVQDGVEYTADVRVMESFPVQLAGTMTLTNRSTETRELSFPDGCVALLRAYHPGESAPIWDQAHEMGCTMAIVPLTLAPGESQEYQTPTSSAADILGDDHPDGEYRITVYVRPQGGVVEVEGGTVDLAIPR